MVHFFVLRPWHSSCLSLIYYRDSRVDSGGWQLFLRAPVSPPALSQVEKDTDTKQRRVLGKNTVFQKKRQEKAVTLEYVIWTLKFRCLQNTNCWEAWPDTCTVWLYSDTTGTVRRMFGLSWILWTFSPSLHLCGDSGQIDTLVRKQIYHHHWAFLSFSFILGTKQVVTALYVSYVSNTTRRLSQVISKLWSEYSSKMWSPIFFEQSEVFRLDYIERKVCIYEKETTFENLENQFNEILTWYLGQRTKGWGEPFPKYLLKQFK